MNGVPSASDTSIPSRRPSWKPPRAATRIALTAVVIAGVAALARHWPGFAQPLSTEIEGAREIVAYQLGAELVSMALPPGAASCRISTNLDLPPDTPEAGIPYVLRVRVPEDGRDESFALIGRPPRDANGRAFGFFRDRAGVPARTVSLEIRRTSTRPAILEVSIEVPGQAARRGTSTRFASALASLRVFVAHERMGLGPAAPLRDRAPAVGGVAIDHLDPDVRAAYLSTGWTRQVARARTPTRTFYLPAIGSSVPPRGIDQDLPVDGGRAIAATVRGPGTIDVQAIAAPLFGSARVLDTRGNERRFALSLAVGERTRIAIGTGLATLRVTHVDPLTTARVRLTASSPKMLLDGDRGIPRDNAVTPTWSWRAVARVQPIGDPVAFAAAGRQQSAFRVTAWARVESPGGSVATVRWRFVDAHGGLLASGKSAVDATPAPEDRLEAVDGTTVLVSRPSTFFLWPPRSAHRLLIEGDRSVDVAVASPGFDRETSPPAALEADLADEIVLRNPPPDHDRQAFYLVRPTNAEELQRAGRIERFGGALRLERRSARPLPSGPAVSLSPRRDGGRFVVLLPMNEAQSGRRPGRLWAMRSQRDEIVTVPRPRGTRGIARVPATLMYELQQPSGRQPVAIHLDGQLVRRASLLGIRGQVVLPPLPVGRHRLRIDLAVPARLFLDQPVVAAAAFRRSQIYVVSRGATAVPFAKARASRSLGVVLYVERPPQRGSASALDVMVDGGKRRRVRAGMSGAYTQLRRRLPLAFERASGAVYLNHGGGAIWASRPLFIPLGDDLHAGMHVVSIRTRGLGARPMARFFSYGGSAANRMNQHVEMSAEVMPVPSVAANHVPRQPRVRIQ